MLDTRPALPLCAALMAACALPTESAFAQSLAYELFASSFDLDMTLSLDLSGNVQGVFDPSTNPGGTRTQPGSNGDDGANAEIPISLALEIDFYTGFDLFGSFDLTLDQDQDSAVVEHFDGQLIDIPGFAQTDATLDFDTFRTFMPASIFSGGIPLRVPLGAADLADFRLVQNGAAFGVPNPSTEPGIFDLTLLLPVELSFTVTAGAVGIGSDPIPVGPLPLHLPLSMRFDLSDCEAFLTAGGHSSTLQTIASPVPGVIEDLQLDLPTREPTGGIANVRLSADLGSFTADLLFSTFFIGESDANSRFERLCAGALNSTGIGAAMDWVGSPSVATEDLGLRVSGLPAHSFGMLLMSPENGFVPGFGGSQGDLCLGDPCFRFIDSIQNSGPAGEITIFPDFDNLPMNATFISADTWNFQLWYRDHNPGATSNTSDALAVLFCE